MFEDSETEEGMEAGAEGVRGPGRNGGQEGGERPVAWRHGGRKCRPRAPASLSCSYIWQHIEIGYVQGMCDLLAPLLVILDDGEYVLPTTPGPRLHTPSHRRGGMLTSLCYSME